MRRWITGALCASLLFGSVPARAARVISKSAANTGTFSPLAAPAPGLAASPDLTGVLPSLSEGTLPTLSAIALPEAVALPAAAIRPAQAAPAAATASAASAPAAARASARETLKGTAARFERAEKGEEKPSEVARQVFDAAKRMSADGGPDAVVPLESAPGPRTAGSMLRRPSVRVNAAAPLPAAYEWIRWRARPAFPEGAPEIAHGRRARLLEAAETAVAGGFTTLVAGGAAALLAQWLSVPIAVGFALAAAASYSVMRGHLGELRDVELYTVQHSHDQRYRVNTMRGGELTDVRGGNKRYGDDRYRKSVPGPIGRTAHLAMRLYAAIPLSLVLLAQGASWQSFAAYNLALLALNALSDRSVAKQDAAWKEFRTPSGGAPLMR